MSAIDTAYAAAQARWPEISGVRAAVYEQHVVQLGVAEANLRQHGEDLYLALGCGVSDPAALRILKHNYLPSIDEHLARSGFDAASRADAIQQVMLDVCAGPSPRILTYAGRASLGTWLQVSAFRLAIQLSAKTAKAKHQQQDDYLLQLVDCRKSPEAELLVGDTQAMFQQALDRAMDRTSERDRTLLRLCFRDGLSIDEIGTLYSVHRATAARWLVQIRKRLLEDVKTQLRQVAAFDESEFESLAAIVRSQLHISVSRVLGAA
jgi:RNA polymerase sigma-70 factor (ECF subfamily)